MKVFISWSGERSLHMAKRLYEWIPLVLQNVEPWLSDESIEAGQRWGAAVAAQLDKSEFGIICLTPENLTAPWLLFEAGALAKSLELARVIPLLHGLDLADLKAPLSQFQGKRLDQAHMLDVVKTLNTRCQQPIDLARLEKSFSAHWPEMERHIAAIPAAASQASPKPIKREIADVLEELVERIQRLEAKISAKTPYPEYNDLSTPVLNLLTSRVIPLDITLSKHEIEANSRTIRRNFPGLLFELKSTPNGTVIAFNTASTTSAEMEKVRAFLADHGLLIRGRA